MLSSNGNHETNSPSSTPSQEIIAPNELQNYFGETDLHIWASTLNTDQSDQQNDFNKIDALFKSIEKTARFEIIKLQTRNKETALHILAGRGRFDLINKILQYMPDDITKLLDIRNKEGKTFLHILRRTKGVTEEFKNCLKLMFNLCSAKDRFTLMFEQLLKTDDSILKMFFQEIFNTELEKIYQAFESIYLMGYKHIFNNNDNSSLINELHSITNIKDRINKIFEEKVKKTILTRDLETVDSSMLALQLACEYYDSYDEENIKKLVLFHKFEQELLNNKHVHELFKFINEAISRTKKDTVTQNDSNTNEIIAKQFAEIEKNPKNCIQKDRQGRTILHNLVMAYDVADEAARVKIEQQLQDLFAQLLDADKLQLIMMPENNDLKSTALHMIVRMKHIHLIKLILDYLVFSEDKEKALMVQDKNGYTVLHFSALMCPEYFSEIFSLYSPESRYAALMGSKRSVIKIIPESYFVAEMDKILLAFTKIYTVFATPEFNESNSLPLITTVNSLTLLKHKLLAIEQMLADKHIKKIFELSLRYYENCHSNNTNLLCDIWLYLESNIEWPIDVEKVVCLVNALDNTAITVEEVQKGFIVSKIGSLEMIYLTDKSSDIVGSMISDIRMVAINKLNDNTTDIIQTIEAFNKLDVLVRQLLKIYIDYDPKKKNKNRQENKEKLLQACTSAYENCLLNFTIEGINEITSSLQETRQQIANDVAHDHASKRISSLLRTKSRFALALQEKFEDENNDDNDNKTDDPHKKFIEADTMKIIRLQDEIFAIRQEFDPLILDKLSTLPANERLNLCSQQDKHGNTILHEFVLKKNKLQEKVEDLLKLLTQDDCISLVKMQNKEGYNALHLAITENVNLIETIIKFLPETERDSIMNTTTYKGRNTVLHLALLFTPDSFESLFKLYSPGGRYFAMAIRDMDGASVISYLPNDLNFPLSEQVIAAFRKIVHAVFNIYQYKYLADTRTMTTFNEKLKAHHDSMGWIVTECLHLSYINAENCTSKNKKLIIDMYDLMNDNNKSLKVSTNILKKIINSLNNDFNKIPDFTYRYADVILEICYRHLYNLYPGMGEVFSKIRNPIIKLISEDEKLKQEFNNLDTFIFSILKLCLEYDSKGNQNREESLSKLLEMIKEKLLDFAKNQPLSSDKIKSVKEIVVSKCREIAEAVQQDHHQHGKLAKVGTESILASKLFKAINKANDATLPSYSSMSHFSLRKSQYPKPLPEHLQDNDISNNNSEKNDLSQFEDIIKELKFKNIELNTKFTNELINSNQAKPIEEKSQQVVRKSENRLSQKLKMFKPENMSKKSDKTEFIQTLINYINITKIKLVEPTDKFNIQIALKEFKKFLEDQIILLRKKSPRNHSKTANDIEDFINNKLVPKLEHRTILNNERISSHTLSNPYDLRL